MDAGAIETLARGLCGEDPLAREDAASGLIRLGEVGVDLFADAAREASGLSAGGRAVAVLGLGMGRQARARDAIVPELDDADWMVRSCAVTALGLVGDAEDVPPVTRRLEDPDHSVRLAAEWALLRLGVARPPEVEVDPEWTRERDGDRHLAAPHVVIVGHILAVSALPPRLIEALESLGFAPSEHEPDEPRRDRPVPPVRRDDDAFALQLLHALGISFGLGPDWNPYDVARHLLESGRMYGPLRRTISRMDGYDMGYAPEDWPRFHWSGDAP